MTNLLVVLLIACSFITRLSGQTTKFILISYDSLHKHTFGCKCEFRCCADEYMKQYSARPANIEELKQFSISNSLCGIVVTTYVGSIENENELFWYFERFSKAQLKEVKLHLKCGKHIQFLYVVNIE